MSIRPRLDDPTDSKAALTRAFDRFSRRWLLILLLLTIACTVLVGSWWWFSETGDPRLRQFVHGVAPVSVVFTSRTETASFVAAAPPGAVFTAPGQPLWQARQGRLRLLTTGGVVRELTWGRLLPHGSTLVDVMSPSVAPDGARILFAGRKASDHGHFRLYQINLDGSGFRQLTGGADDDGCSAVPPLRYSGTSEHAELTPEARRRTDYDDVDPIVLSDGRILFVSSRHPDLGRGHARRSTVLWVMNADGSGKTSYTANRNNDRWPFLMTSNFLLFSLWSRNTEVISADERSIEPYVPGTTTTTRPTDSWLGATLIADGTRLGAAVKVPVPVWRPRPLFNGRIAFMTSAQPAAEHDEPPTDLTVVQAEVGLIRTVPSALVKEQALPSPDQEYVQAGPTRDATGRELRLATPSPCPDHFVLLSTAALEPGERFPNPGRFGISLAEQDWPLAHGDDPQLLFDDPDFVDAEPVAVYARPLVVTGQTVPPLREPEATLTLAGGISYTGPIGQLVNPSLVFRQNEGMPGQRTDRGESPVFDAPPRGLIDHLRIYAARRDRFDDPVAPRTPGVWELLKKVPLKPDGMGFDVLLPAGVPTVLAGFNAADRVARWTSPAADRAEQHATVYAFAGDHYSGLRRGQYEFCVGCHPGHSGPGVREHRERRR